MEVWIRLYREAEDQMVAEAGLEDGTRLRRMTRSKDEKIVVRASDILNKAPRHRGCARTKCFRTHQRSSTRT